jgi:regulation of enolase protein 1 (concanavalin A-like superfamily)
MAGQNGTGLNLVSTGSGLARGTNASDAFHFVYTPVSGDFVIVAAITGMTDVHDWTRSGLMVRETLGPGSLFMSIGKNPYEVLHTTNWRVSEGSETLASEKNTSCEADDIWLRLVRSGSTVTAFSSADGEQWDTVSQHEAAMAEDAYVGVFDFNRGVKEAHTVVFHGVSLNGSDIVATGAPLGPAAAISRSRRPSSAVWYDARGRLVTRSRVLGLAVPRALARGVYCAVIGKGPRGVPRRVRVMAW